MRPRQLLEQPRAYSICSALVLAALAIGCGGGSDSPTGPAQPAAVSTVTVTGVATLEVGETSQLVAVPHDASGNSLTGRSVSWGSSLPNIASVSDGGLVTAAAPGSATITATVEGKSGTASVGVTSVAVATVEVSLVSNSLVSGRTTQADAIVKGSKGQVLTGRPIVWSSSAQGIASVSSAGVITGAAAGTANIVATTEGKTGSAPITVTLPPVATVTLTPAAGYLIAGTSGQVGVTLQDASGTVLTGRAISWASTNPAIATVNSTGIVTGLTAGTAAITAESEGVTGSMSLTVTSVGVATVTLTPSAGALYVGDAGSFTLTLRDAAGNVLTGRSVIWSSSAPSIAPVAPSGVVSGLSVGTATITATSEGKSGSATVTVANKPGAPADLCTIIAGGTIVASDNQFLGSLTNKFNSQSVLNEFGNYGSKYASFSIWNDYGNYGGQYAIKSPFNPYTTTPPKLVLKGGQTFYWLTVNPYIGGGYVNPYFLLTCTNFP